MDASATNSLQQRFVNHCITSRDPGGSILANQYRRQLEHRDSALENGEGVILDEEFRSHNLSPIRIALATTQQELSESFNEFLEECLETQKAMPEESIKSIGNSRAVHRLVLKLMQVANELQDAIGESGDVHCFLSCSTHNHVKQVTNRKSFPIVFKLYHLALIANNIGVAIAAQAIRDAHTITQKVRNGHLHSRKDFALSAEPKTMLPTWFPWSREDNPTRVQNSTFISCDTKIVHQLETE